MIKIHLKNEKSILDFHYKNLTEKDGRKRNVIDRIKRKIASHAGSQQLLSMYEFLLSKVEKDTNGYSILTATPIELESFLNNFETNYSSLKSPNIIKEFKHIFYYDDYEKWKPYALAKSINLNVCPYCNRSYTFLLGDDTNKGVRFEYDHFYARAVYPYLGLSFYNLIPSCHICNSNLKGKNEFSLKQNIHPYVEGFSDNMVFSIKPRDIQFINGKHSAYRIKFKKGAKSNWGNTQVLKAIRNISTFRLTKLYNMHKDHVDLIIQKSIAYPNDHIKGLFNQFQGTLFKNEEDVQRFVLGTYTEEENYSKVVLSKLTADISRELGII